MVDSSRLIIKILQFLVAGGLAIILLIPYNLKANEDAINQDSPVANNVSVDIQHLFCHLLRNFSLFDNWAKLKEDVNVADNENTATQYVLNCLQRSQNKWNCSCQDYNWVLIFSLIFTGFTLLVALVEIIAASIAKEDLGESLVHGFLNCFWSIVSSITWVVNGILFYILIIAKWKYTYSRGNEHHLHFFHIPLHMYGYIALSCIMALLCVLDGIRILAVGIRKRKRDQQSKSLMTTVKQTPIKDKTTQPQKHHHHIHEKPPTYYKPGTEPIQEPVETRIIQPKVTLSRSLGKKVTISGRIDVASGKSSASRSDTKKSKGSGFEIASMDQKQVSLPPKLLDDSGSKESSDPKQPPLVSLLPLVNDPESKESLLPPKQTESAKTDKETKVAANADNVKPDAEAKPTGGHTAKVSAPKIIESPKETKQVKQEKLKIGVKSTSEKRVKDVSKKQVGGVDKSDKKHMKEPLDKKEHKEHVKHAHHPQKKKETKQTKQVKEMAEKSTAKVIRKPLPVKRNSTSSKSSRR